MGSGNNAHDSLHESITLRLRELIAVMPAESPSAEDDDQGDWGIKQ